MRRVISPTFLGVLDYEEKGKRSSGQSRASSKGRIGVFAASLFLTLALISIPSIYYSWRSTNPSQNDITRFLSNEKSKSRLKVSSTVSRDTPGSHAFDIMLSTDGLNDVSESNLNSTASNSGTPVTPVRYTGEGRHRSGDGKKIELVETVADLDSGIFGIEEKIASLPKVEGQQRMLVRLGETNGEDGHGQAVEGTRLLSFPKKTGRVEESREADNNLRAVERNQYSSNGQRIGPDRNTGDDQSCPVYQQYTMEDLNPWVQRGGISLANLETARGLATFRVQIVNESVYVHEWAKCFQTRAKFTIWGILQLIQSYPGRVPDVDLFFECNDGPVVERAKFDFHPTPPPVLSFCSTGGNLDLVWPDWSFWGWPEINLHNWTATHASILQNTASTPWEARISRAFWKGAVWVAPGIRQPIVDCNDDPLHRWHVESSDTAWDTEKDKNSTKLENQCDHRYKIYAEGTSWSCSLKYILACASTVLRVNPLFFDFFSRQLERNVHFLPIPRHDESPICPSFKEAVEWGELHEEEAKLIGLRGADFVEHQLSMRHVYDYMLNFLMQYHKIMRFDVDLVHESRLHTVESMLADATDLERQFMVVESASHHVPCFLRAKGV